MAALALERWFQGLEWLASAIYPTPCVACPELSSVREPPLCAGCWSRMPRLFGPRCRCGQPLSTLIDIDQRVTEPAIPTPLEPVETPCGRCQKEELLLGEIASLGPYTGVLKEAVGALKYRRRHRTARSLSRRMVVEPHLRRLFDGTDVLVPVAMHADREEDRSFNHAGLLAEAMASALGGRPHVIHGLIRIRNTQQQAKTRDVAQRAANVRGAFVHSGVPLPPRVLLVDDVATSGATLKECARTLLAAGAREVSAITVARAE